MNTDFIFRVVDHLLVTGQTPIGGTDGDMVGRNTKKLQTLLNGYANNTATTPQADDESWSEAAVSNLQAELVGVA